VDGEEAEARLSELLEIVDDAWALSLEDDGFSAGGFELSRFNGGGGAFLFEDMVSELRYGVVEC
jgi:hypothetical protein